MAIISPFEGLQSVASRGRFGFSGGLGALRLGFNRLGYFQDEAGIYQRKKTRSGWELSRSLIYSPTNPRTTLQQAWRSVFAAGRAAYVGLTPEQRALYSKQASGQGLSGYNLFMRKWLHSHR